MMVRRILVAACAILVLAGGAAWAQSDDECLQPGGDDLLKQGCASLDEFMKTFNARDAKAWSETLHYPHIRIAGGQTQIWNTPEEYASSNDARELEKSSGWSHSKWSQRKLVQKSPDKLHFVTRFTRYDANDKPMLSADSFYVLVKKDGRWGTQFRSSFVGALGKKTAF